MRYPISTFLIAITLVLLSAPPAFASIIIKAANNLGLVGYWSFNEGTGTFAGDGSGHGNTGTLGGSPTWVTGKLGQALNFDGATQYVGVGANVNQAGVFTVDAWIKPSVALPTDKMQIVSNSSLGNAQNYTFEFGRTASRLPTVWGNTVILTSNTDIPINVWTHVALVRTGSAGNWTATLYVNGVQDGTATTAVDPNMGSSACVGTWIGALCDTGNFSHADTGFFQGSLDEVRIYNRALSPAEIAGQYKYGASRVNASSATLANGSTLANGLVGYWTMDGADITTSVVDRSGQGNNGGFVGGATSSAKTIGKLGQALNFNGSSNYVNVGRGSSLNVSGAITVSAWIYPRATACASFCDIVSNYDAGGTIAQYELTIQAQTISFDVGNGPSQADTGTTLLTPGRWYHIVATRDAANTASQIYINGVADTVNRSGSVSPPTSSFGNTAIGRPGDFNGQYFPGLIDDVRIYNRALSASEVNQLYNLGGQKLNTSSQTLTNGSTLTSGLVGHWTFDGPDITRSVLDKSGQGNNGGFVGGATSSAKTIGKLGQALSFNGSTNYVDLGLGQPGGLSITGALTISAWVKFSSLSCSSGCDIVSNYDAAGLNAQYELYMLGGTIGFGNATAGAGYGFTTSASVITSTGTWYHIVVTRDASATHIPIYINGVSQQVNLQGSLRANDHETSESEEFSLGA